MWKKEDAKGVSHVWGQPKLSDVVYNSDLVIRDALQATSLCVFYDRVYLPYTSSETSLELIGTNEVGTGVKQTSESRNDIRDWETLYGVLFKEKVLERLNKPGDLYLETEQIFQTVRLWSKSGPYSERFRVGDQVLEIGNAPRKRVKASPDGPETVTYETEAYIDVRRKVVRPIPIDTEFVIKVDAVPSLLALHVDKIGSGTSRFIRTDLVKHLLRSDIRIPQVFVSVDGYPNRELLVALEAQETFGYLLPKIGVPHPTEILRIREKVKDTREGFREHLYKLSKGLDESAKSGAAAEEIARFARDLISTELIPDYKEFCRQLNSMRADGWGKIIEVASKALEMDSAVWTPKFFAMLLKTLGLTVLANEAEREKLLSNKYQAFKFMSEVESEAPALVGRSA